MAPLIWLSLTSSPGVKEICLTSRTWAWCYKQYYVWHQVRSLTSSKSSWHLKLTSSTWAWWHRRQALVLYIQQITLPFELDVQQISLTSRLDIKQISLTSIPDVKEIGLTSEVLDVKQNQTSWTNNTTIFLNNPNIQQKMKEIFFSSSWKEKMSWKKDKFYIMS